LNEILLRRSLKPTCATLLFVAGAATAQQFSRLPDGGVIFALSLLALFLFSLQYRLASSYLFGLSWALASALIGLASALPTALEGKDLTIEGTVADLPEAIAGAQRFHFTVEKVLSPSAARVPEKVRLSWYKAPARVIAGEGWRLTVRLKRPHSTYNPGAFDYEKWLFTQGVRAHGYVRSVPDNRSLGPAGSGFSPLHWRQLLADRLSAALGGDGFAGVIKALTMGADDDISAEQWETLRRTGTTHLVVVSGSHIGLIAGIVFFAVRRLASALGVQRWPPQVIAAIAAVLAAAFYSALAGFAIPTQRALIMVTVAMGGIVWQRNVSSTRVLTTALLLVVLYDPLAVLSAGFWLSFLAVGLIILALGQRVGTIGNWRAMLRVNWVVALGLVPILLLLFQSFSFVSPLANLVAVPLIGFIAVPASLMGSFILLFQADAGRLVLQVAEGSVGWLWAVLEWLANLSSAQWEQARPALWTLPFAMLGVVMLTAPRGIPARWLGMVLFIPLVSTAPERPATGSVWLTLLDVGQGLAAVVLTKSHALAFDTGARYSERFDMGRAVIEPFLHRQGIRRIDVLVISHGDNDHIGGAQSLLRRFVVGAIYTSVPQRLTPARSISCQAGQSWSWDGVRFEMLAPFGHSGPRENDDSCVLKITGKGGSLLLTGDIERPAERRLLEHHDRSLTGDVLVVPHHGSNTSSTDAFLRKLRPRYALISAGYRNRYGFPHPAVLDRYRQLGISASNTADAGAIRVVMDAERGISAPESYRMTNGKYWNARPEAVAD
jgi:competence protein ComEC